MKTLDPDLDLYPDPDRYLDKMLDPYLTLPKDCRKKFEWNFMLLNIIYYFLCISISEIFSSDA
jgi:hypothetical protein